MSGKAELRADFAARRASLDPKEKDAADKRIVQVIVRSRAYRDAQTVFGYYPVRGEIDLYPLYAHARSQAKTVAFPVCGQDHTLTFLTDTGRTRQGAYGIPIPTGAPAPADARTLCLVPGYAYDLSRRRLGYGGGYYDRFLVGFPGVSMGVFYDAFALPALPADRFDIPCDLIATEKGIF